MFSVYRVFSRVSFMARQIRAILVALWFAQGQGRLVYPPGMVRPGRLGTVNRKLSAQPNLKEHTSSGTGRYKDQVSQLNKRTGRKALRRRLSKGLQYALLVASSVEAVVAVTNNDYERMRVVRREETTFGKRVYSSLFYFARLRPRLLFAVGALLRALQLCTPLQRIFNPSAGVGGGLHLCSMLAGSRWPSPVVLGWSVTRPFWEALGAQSPRGAQVPISISIDNKSSGWLWGGKRKCSGGDDNNEETP